ncbi:sensor histidine kinase [Paenibacillus alkalitolerans]|uniref:sensor histidine kinase n=1 Tax=Paenibacillus alkalitolerans TaxID=2799335 RepID=UPI0018F4B607|nr:sensor histidine kinase [Paenibacillus alkalitolerans]
MRVNRIVVKLGGTIILLFLVILLPLGFVMNQIITGFYYNQVQKEIGKLASRYADAIASNRDAMTVGMIEMMSAYSDVKLVITDVEGRVIANSGIAWIGEELRIAEAERKLLEQGRSVQIEMEDTSSDERFIAIGQPVINQNQYYGSVFVFSSVSGMDESLQKVRQLLILSSIGAFFLALGFTFIVSKKLSEPLIQMENATRRISKGDLDVRVRIPSDDEVGSLAKAVNDLAVDLQRYRDTRREFLANVSHELRTPMTHLEGYAKVLKEELYETEEEKRKYLDIIYQESVRLSHLIYDLFELSKMEEGKISLQMESTDLSDLIINVIRKIEPKASGKGLKIRMELPDDLPLVYVDGLRMEQVFFNLLDNAIRYTEQGSIWVQVIHSAACELITVIEDTGVGIPAHELPYIFERFYRVEKSRSREYGGTGLGLAIVKQLVELQGGAIQVFSEIGKGTRFEIILPVGGDARETD